jgi:Fic family protein
MLHEFRASQIDASKCVTCKRSETDHTCDICDASGNVEVYENNLWCASCYQSEQAANQRVASMNQTVETRNQNLLKEDATIQIVTDIFNAKIASINELRQAIEADSSIENKQFALAKTLEERFKHLRSVITGANETIKDAQNEQRAIQTYYNDLAKKLRADEREQIKLQDVQYRPPEKPASKPKAPVIKKYDKQQVKMAAAQSGIPEAVIQMTCVARNVTPMEAVRILRESGLAAKE